MIHFLYLIGFAFFVSVGFGVFTNGSTKDKFLSGLKSFAQFVLISVALAWLFYFFPL